MNKLSGLEAGYTKAIFVLTKITQENLPCFGAPFWQASASKYPVSLHLKEKNHNNFNNHNQIITSIIRNVFNKNSKLLIEIYFIPFMIEPHYETEWVFYFCILQRSNTTHKTQLFWFKKSVTLFISNQWTHARLSHWIVEIICRYIFFQQFLINCTFYLMF